MLFRSISHWATGGHPDEHRLREIRERFSDDLDTPAAMLLLRKLERDESIPEAVRRATFVASDALLGLDLDREDLKELSSEQLAFLDERARVRAEKNWARSDQLRDQLLQMGIRVNDGPDGQTWEIN